MTDPHADLRAMLAVHPESYIITNPPSAPVFSWLKNAPALVRDLMKERDKLVEHLRALLEERDKMAEQLAARPRADVYVTAASHNDAMRALERERDALKVERDNLAALLGNFANGKLWSNRGELDAALAERLDADPAFRTEMHAAWRERLLAFEEEKMRCEIAAAVLGHLLCGHETEDDAQFNYDIGRSHDYADALIAEARRRKEEGK